MNSIIRSIILSLLVLFTCEVKLKKATPYYSTSNVDCYLSTDDCLAAISTVLKGPCYKEYDDRWEYCYQNGRTEYCWIQELTCNKEYEEVLTKMTNKCKNKQIIPIKNRLRPVYAHCINK